ncbi:hypothetical protein GW17_00059846, partial [Ensete ventricosum]
MEATSKVIVGIAWEGGSVDDGYRGDRLVVDGANGLYVVGHAMALVLRASWFSLSLCSHAKEMAALSVYDYRALTSSRISDFKPSMEVLNIYFSDQSWLISVRRCQPGDLSQKAATKVEEEEGSSDVGCGYAATSWLWVAWSRQGCNCNKRKMGQRCARLLRRRIVEIRSERPLLVMFN